MSAAILPFTGQAKPRHRRSSSAAREDSRAVYDARLIKRAKRENDDWTARMLLALLETLSPKQLDALEFRLLGPVALTSESACQALAIVQLFNGTKAHRDRIRHMLERMDGPLAE